VANAEITGGPNIERKLLAISYTVTVRLYTAQQSLSVWTVILMTLTKSYLWLIFIILFHALFAFALKLFQKIAPARPLTKCAVFDAPSIDRRALHVIPDAVVCQHPVNR
jgi:hypothetical protein